MVLWRNWSRTESARPARVVRPADVAGVVTAVRAAARDGLRVKAVGAGHSFTGIAVTDGVLLDLSRMSGVRSLDRESGLVTVDAGIPLHQLNRILDGCGLAMSNLGDIDQQTVAGAISTGTHGTGAAFGGLATQVEELELVLADGTVATCSMRDRPGLFAAARIGLGALGVITAVTLRCEPAFALHAREEPMQLADVLGNFGELVGTHDHFEFYWLPHTERTLTKRNDRMPAGTVLQPLSRLRGWADDELLSNRIFELSNRAASRAPRAIPRINAALARAVRAREYVDVSHRVFASPRRVVFREMEYAVPRDAAGQVLREIRDWVEGSGELISFPVEVRVAAADDIWLSTAHGRSSAYIAVHQYHRRPYERYFRAVEKIATAAGGRPHWGKVHWLEAPALRERYPRFDDFVGLRDDLDPAGLFTNPYLDRVLGRPPG